MNYKDTNKKFSRSANLQTDCRFYT